MQSAVLNSQMIESLRGIETIKCNACEERELEALEREYIKSLKISLRSSKISTGQSLISSVIMTVLNMVTTYVGITQVLNGQLTLGGYSGVQHPFGLLYFSGERAHQYADVHSGGFHFHEAPDGDHGL